MKCTLFFCFVWWTLFSFHQWPSSNCRYGSLCVLVHGRLDFCVNKYQTFSCFIAPPTTDPSRESLLTHQRQFYFFNLFLFSLLWFISFPFLLILSYWKLWFSFVLDIGKQCVRSWCGPIFWVLYFIVLLALIPLVPVPGNNTLYRPYIIFLFFL